MTLTAKQSNIRPRAVLYARVSTDLQDRKAIARVHEQSVLYLHNIINAMMVDARRPSDLLLSRQEHGRMARIIGTKAAGLVTWLRCAANAVSSFRGPLLGLPRGN